MTAMSGSGNSIRKPPGGIRGPIGQMLFSGEDALKPTSALSGGECARLIFCKLMLQKPNVLVFDEPTNNLDLESINALNIALQKYEGTVLLVTHDEDVLDEVATRIWHFSTTATSRTSKAPTKNSKPTPHKKMPPQSRQPNPAANSSSGILFQQEEHAPSKISCTSSTSFISAS
jgi:ATPase subunit of ABC transporter with duplicated ATPase domains